MSRNPLTITEITRRLRRRGLSIRHELRSNELALIVLCAPLGAFVGLVVVAMHEIVTWLHVFNFALPPDSALSTGVGIDQFRLALVPAGGGLILGLVSAAWRRFGPPRRMPSSAAACP